MNNAAIQLYEINMTDAQKRVMPDDCNGWWTFVNVNSGKVIDIVVAVNSILFY